MFNLLLLGSGAFVNGNEKEVAVLKGSFIALTESIDDQCVN